MSVLLLAEHDNASLKEATLHVITAATKLGGGIDILGTGSGAEGAAVAAAAIPGVAKVLHVDTSYLAQPTAENVAATMLEAIRRGNYSHVVAAATSFGKNVMPRVAAKLDVAQVSDITSIESPDTFVRPIYAGNAFATVRANDPVKVITVRTTAFDAAASSGGSATIETMQPAPEVTKARVVGQELTKSERP